MQPTQLSHPAKLCSLLSFGSNGKFTSFVQKLECALSTERWEVPPSHQETLSKLFTGIQPWHFLLQYL